MLTYDLIVSDLVKLVKHQQVKLASAGKKVALVERSKAMYGGTCINIGCIPTKNFCQLLLRKTLSFEEVIATKKHDHWSPQR